MVSHLHNVSRSVSNFDLNVATDVH